MGKDNTSGKKYKKKKIEAEKMSSKNSFILHLCTFTHSGLISLVNPPQQAGQTGQCLMLIILLIWHTGHIQIQNFK